MERYVRVNDIVAYIRDHGRCAKERGENDRVYKVIAECVDQICQPEADNPDLKVIDLSNWKPL